MPSALSPEQAPATSSSRSEEWPDHLPSLHLDDMAQGGEAIGRYQGRIVFVQGGLPGEIVSVRLTHTHKTYARGVVQTIHTTAAERVDPQCSLFGRCGGCQWQYISYPAQLAFKTSILVEQCRRLGGLEDLPIAPMLGMQNPWDYRGTTKLHLSPKGQLGYYGWHSHDVVPMESCPLLVSALNAVIPPLSLLLQEIPSAHRPRTITLRYSWTEQSRLVLIRGGTRQGSSLLHNGLIDFVPEISWLSKRKAQRLAGRGFFLEQWGGTPLQVSPTSFFQVNVPQAQKLLQVVTEMIDPSLHDHLLDAYAGVGALSLPLADRVEKVTAIESHPVAVKDLRENARRIKGGNVQAIQAKVERFLPLLEQTPTLVVVDPPRRGCREAIPAILQHRPRRIVYVSCHPGTLARDLRELCAGGYHLAQIQPVDLFPQTFHIESVTLLERKDG
jgi:23S rRNA (uracil1939-C5)-methyltransferase